MHGIAFWAKKAYNNATLYHPHLQIARVSYGHRLSDILKGGFSFWSYQTEHIVGSFSGKLTAYAGYCLFGVV